jgi:hypothetical protein
MLYRRNVGSKEAWARVLGGVLMLAWAFTQAGATPMGLGLAAGGAVAVLTGLFGYCPACALVGRKPVGDGRDRA